MKESPILFSAPMVIATLDGTKTQTRRIIKRPIKHPGWTGYTVTYAQDGAIECGPDYPDGEDDFVKCPYGQPGDRLWGRENFWLDRRNKDRGPNQEVIYSATPEIYRDPHGKLKPCRWPSGSVPFGETEDLTRAEAQHQVETNKNWFQKPSIFMWRWASRILRDITEIRVEQLQDISDADCHAEGVPVNCDAEPRDIYMEIWNAINGKDSWNKNPWVWVLTTKEVLP